MASPIIFVAPRLPNKRDIEGPIRGCGLIEIFNFGAISDWVTYRTPPPHPLTVDANRWVG